MARIPQKNSWLMLPKKDYKWIVSICLLSFSKNSFLSRQPAGWGGVEGSNLQGSLIYEIKLTLESILPDIQLSIHKEGGGGLDLERQLFL